MTFDDGYTEMDAAADEALTRADIEAHEFDDLDLLRDEDEPFDEEADDDDC